MDAAGTIPCRAGVGLKPAHVRAIVDDRPDIGFFEIHAENYMGAGGPPHRWLTAIRARYPISVHGVGLSIGGPGPLDAGHLARLKAVVDRYQPSLVSEHLAWSSHAGRFLDDLLPVPGTDEALAVVCDHVDQVQTALGRPILLENPAHYMAYADGGLAEPQFLAAVVARTGCFMLLDLANIFVSAVNLAGDAAACLNACPLAAVRQIHLAGHAERAGDGGRRLLVDTHGAAVPAPVWSLLDDVLGRLGPVPTLIEWDNDLPEWRVLAAEAARADTALLRAARREPPADDAAR